MKIAVAAAGVLALSLSACSGSDAGKKADGKGAASEANLTVWAPQEDQTDSNAWLPKMEAAFEKAHPEYKITWKNAVVSEGDAAKTVNADPAAAADVYLFANDQLGSLLEATAIGELSDEGMEQLKKQNSETMIASVSDKDGKAYGLPTEPNTWFMYYNKAKFSAEDVKSLDTMLAKGKVAFPLSNAWYYPSFYVGAGGTFFGENGLDAKAGINYGPKQEEVTKYLVNLAKNANFVNDVEGAGLGGLKSGTVDAIFSGAWDAKNVQEALGDNYAVAALPMYNLGGEQVQLRSFSGSKAAAYNPNSKNTKIASQFAAFLASDEAQKAHYEIRGTIPVAKTLAADSTISKDPVAVALFEVIANNSILQPTIKEMGTFWEPGENFAKAIVNGEITESNAAEKTTALQEAFNK
ncbi:extracellular solute-binding protein [Arcanobacterium hippocoleae]|uniref:extracellular solute-binding protein n=1 Tax=Arcanobacterium hippocoleae TaxID=149017 RepID=UPI00333EB385